MAARAKTAIRIGLGIGALAAALLLPNKQAHAQWSASGVPGIPNIPPSVLNQWMQNATQQGQQKQAPIPMPTAPGSSCPPVEIAPGISIPVCANSFPKPPPGVLIPEALLTMPAFVAPAVDLRTQGLDGPVKDQKQTGVCYAFALSSVLESSLRKQGRQDVLSPLHVVAADAWENLWSSSSRATEAIGPESTWPYDPIKACKLEKGPDECEHAYGIRTGTWRSDPQLVNERERQRSFGVAVSGKAASVPRRGDQVQGVTTALAQGRVILATINIDSRAWGFRGINSQGVLADYEVGDRGGHAVTLVGYRPAAGNTRQYLIHNSWGTSWGQNGYAWITEQSLRKHLTDAWLVDAQPSSSGGNAPPPPPPPPVPSTQNACSTGTALDLGTGRCAPVCRSGLAPFGGHCPFG